MKQQDRYQHGRRRELIEPWSRSILAAIQNTSVLQIRLAVRIFIAVASIVTLAGSQAPFESTM